MRALVMMIVFAAALAAHDLQHRVTQSECIAVRFVYGDGSDFSYQPYELYAPGDKIPYQVGRTDREASLCFRPTQEGEWLLKAFGEDGHGATVTIRVDRTLAPEAYDRPLFEKFQKILVGLSVLIILFGGFFYYKKRKENA